MTAGQLSAHVVSDGDTVEQIVRRYGLSSRTALTEIPANASVRELLVSDAPLLDGLLIFIPPRAALLIRDRLYCLQTTRPLVIAHFDACRERLANDLGPAILGEDAPDHATAVSAQLADLSSAARTTIENVARATQPLIPVCKAMVLTHVASETDHAVVDAANDPMCSMYWCITPPLLEFWRDFWEPSGWREKWQGKSADAALKLLEQQLNTLSSLVVQQIDQRIRDAQSLENALRAGR